jgi:hypothetical protein
MIGGAGGAIYGAASADPRMGESRLSRALWGAGIGAVGGGIGGAMIGAGINRAKGVVSGLAAGPKAPSALALQRMKNARSIREQISRESVSNGVMGWNRTGGWAGRGSPVRLNREPRVWSKAKGAFGNALRRAKAHKRSWTRNHRAAKTNKVYANARKMLPKARRDFWTARAEPYANSIRRFPGESQAIEQPIPLTQRNWSNAVSARPIKSVGSPGREASPIDLMNRTTISPAEEARWAGRRNQINARTAGLNPIGGGAYPPGTPRGEGWVMPNFSAPRTATESQRAARMANRGNSLAAFAAGQYAPTRATTVDALAAGFGEQAQGMRSLLGF